MIQKSKLWVQIIPCSQNDLPHSKFTVKIDSCLSSRHYKIISSEFLLILMAKFIYFNLVMIWINFWIFFLTKRAEQEKCWSPLWISDNLEYQLRKCCEYFWFGVSKLNLPIYNLLEEWSQWLCSNVSSRSSLSNLLFQHISKLHPFIYILEGALLLCNISSHVFDWTQWKLFLLSMKSFWFN